MSDKITVVINTLNEAENLPRAIKSVKNLADEIVVVDMESEDGTPDLAKELGAKVFKHKKVGYVEPARNFAISKAVGDWVLILDADEEITQKLSEKIKKIVKNPEADYYRIPRKNIIFGKWLKHSRWWPDYNIRLFKKGTVVWNEVIHAVPMTQGKGLEIEEKEEFAIVHHNYSSVDQYLSRMNRYTRFQKELLVSEGYKFNWKDLIKKPVSEFLSRYFAGEGYKDGLHGLSLSILQAFSEFVIYLKVWESSKFIEPEVNLNEVLKTVEDEERNVRFWKADARFKETGNIKERIRRKFKI